MPRRLSTSLLLPGMTLGRTLYDDTGRTLLRQGTILKESLITKLLPLFASVYITDDQSKDIEIAETVPMQLRLEVQKLLADEWTRLSSSANFERVTFESHFAMKLRRNMVNLLDVLRNTESIQEDLASLASFDNLTYVHSMNVTIYSIVVGVALQMNEAALIDLALGAVLHDIGKLWVPLDVLNKPGPLSPEEYQQMKNHTIMGHDFLAKQMELSYLVAHCAFQHHERIDGSGYPRCLTGDEMHLYAKIIAVADVYDAMVMNRPYRDGCAPAYVMEYLFSRAGIEYDLQVVGAFSKKVAMYPVGTEVTLSDGSVAVVVRMRDNLPSRPVVRLLRDASGQAVPPQDIDLTSILNLTILRSSDAAALTSID